VPLRLDARRILAYGDAMPRALLFLLASAALGCGMTRTEPPPPTGLTSLAVAPVENKTGSALVVSGDGYVAKWLGWQKRTFADVLGHELEAALRERGFAVGGTASRLRVVLTRVEPDLPQLDYVGVSYTATLVDADGTVRWSTEQSNWPVSTMGSPSLSAAYETTARTIARGLVDDWQPAH
jgi:hypothetical protein